MYPSKIDPLFGVFVKNFKSLLEKEGVIFSAISVIKGKRDNKLSKAFSYSKYYSSVAYNFFAKKYDLVYVHYLSHNSPILSFLLPVKNKPLVINVHGTDVLSSQGKKIDVLNKRVLRKTDLVVVPSGYFKNIILTNYPFLEQAKVFVSPSAGVDSEKFYPIASEENEIPILGMISRIDTGKGWEDFVNALDLLKMKGMRFRAIIAGQGLEEKQMMEMIKDLNLTDTIDFLGLVKQDELVHLYNTMDAFVFPTKREAESLGLVGLEAMSCRTPVIGSDIAGLKTYIKHEVNGLLYPPGNVEKLAESIERYLQFPAQRKEEIKEQAYKTAQAYESKAVILKLHKRLSKLCLEN